MNKHSTGKWTTGVFSIAMLFLPEGKFQPNYPLYSGSRYVLGKKKLCKGCVCFLFYATKIVDRLIGFLPIQSMYRIFAYIWLIFMVNVGKYTIHGCYGLGLHTCTISES